MIKAFTLITLLAFIKDIGFSQVAGSPEHRNTLNQELAIAKDDTSRVLIMADLARYFWTDFDSCSIYGYRALALAKRIQFSRGEASVLNALGGSFQNEGDYPKSLEHLYKSLQIAEQKDYHFETAVSYALIGNTYWFLADWPKAIDFCNKSQQIFEGIFNQHGVNEWMLFNVLNIGQSYLELNLDSAHYYLSQYYDAMLRNKFWHPVALYSLGDCLFRQGDGKTSLNYVRKGIAEATANSDYLTEAEACAVISRFFITRQQVDSAIYYAKVGLRAADSIAYVFGIYKDSKLLAEVYELSNLQEALYYRKIYDSVNERMYGAKKVQDLQKTLADEQQRQQQIQEEQIERASRLRQYGFMAGLGIMLLIAFILYRNNLHRKKANQLLNQQKQRVEATLQELRSTQGQLIQSEKMASLGELTAGIAHEIQNPLNFVNNFSDVNSELIDETTQAINAGNQNEAKELLLSLRENELKIKFHGQRADAIVKGMLQHSKASAGQKESININAIAEECLKLSYHALRAKEKSFNAHLETHFDDNNEKISVVQQDIVRVLVNLFNNAFYAVSEKSKLGIHGYEPTVSVSTKKLDDTVEIRVKDNGTGIPQKVVDKIFQPFVTTEPTGQGTGLGLSLSYDIVKAHRGEISVNTKEGEFTEFVIQLPTNSVF